MEILYNTPFKNHLLNIAKWRIYVSYLTNPLGSLSYKVISAMQYFLIFLPIMGQIFAKVYLSYCRTTKAIKWVVLKVRVNRINTNLYLHGY